MKIFKSLKNKKNRILLSNRLTKKKLANRYKYMSYTTYYNSQEDIANSNEINKDALNCALRMYTSDWAMSTNHMTFTDEKMSLVYSFNVAEGLRRRIMKAKDYRRVIDDEVDHLCKPFWSGKKRSCKVVWLYQRHAILGILYYLLAMHDGFESQKKEYLKKRAQRLKLPLFSFIHLKMKGCLDFFEIFENAVHLKQKEQAHKIQTGTSEGNADSAVEKSSGKITKESVIKNQSEQLAKSLFEENLDIAKVIETVSTLQKLKDSRGKQFFLYKHDWYIIYYRFYQIGFLKRKNCRDDLFLWLKKSFDLENMPTDKDFDQAKSKLKNKTEGYFHLHELEICVNELFKAEKDKSRPNERRDYRDNYVLEGKYIYWKGKDEQLKDIS